MKLKKVSKLFIINYGNSIGLNLLDLSSKENGIPFISRGSKYNGISNYVKKIKSIETNKPDTITVALSGSVMEAFLQKYEYYTGYHIFILTPKIKLKDEEMLYYCMCLRANKYKYSYGRQANKTLKDLLIPDTTEIPDWVYTTKIDMPSSEPLINNKIELDTSNWKYFEYSSIFNIERGKTLNYGYLLGNCFPLIGASQNENGSNGEYINFYDYDGKYLTIGNAGNTGCGQTFYQEGKFSAKSTVNLVLLRNYELNKYIAMFLTTIIRMEQYRYNFGRGWGIDRMKLSKIKLPAITVDDNKDEPDWQFMEDYIKSLPYSSSI